MQPLVEEEVPAVRSGFWRVHVGENYTKLQRPWVVRQGVHSLFTEGYYYNLPHMIIKTQGSSIATHIFNALAFNPPFFRPAFPKGYYRCSWKYLCTHNSFSTSSIPSTPFPCLELSYEKARSFSQGREVTAEYEDKGALCHLGVLKSSFLVNKNNLWQSKDLGGNVMRKAKSH